METGDDKSDGHVPSVGSVHVGGIILLSVLPSKVYTKSTGSWACWKSKLGVWY